MNGLKVRRIQEGERQMTVFWVVSVLGALMLGLNLGVVVMALIAGRDPN
jgi:hypothetical protein